MASKRNLRRKTCGQKVAYASLDDAKASMREIRGKNKRRGHLTRSTHLNAFQCDFCGRYHIGHRPGVGQSIARRRYGH